MFINIFVLPSIHMSIVWFVFVVTQCLLILLLSLHSSSDRFVFCGCLRNELLISCVYKILPFGYTVPICCLSCFDLEQWLERMSFTEFGLSSSMLAGFVAEIGLCFKKLYFLNLQFCRSFWVAFSYGVLNSVIFICTQFFFS